MRSVQHTNNLSFFPKCIKKRNLDQRVFTEHTSGCVTCQTIIAIPPCLTDVRGRTVVPIGTVGVGTLEGVTPGPLWASPGLEVTDCIITTVPTVFTAFPELSPRTF